MIAGFSFRFSSDSGASTCVPIVTSSAFRFTATSHCGNLLGPDDRPPTGSGCGRRPARERPRQSRLVRRRSRGKTGSSHAARRINDRDKMFARQTSKRTPNRRSPPVRSRKTLPAPAAAAAAPKVPCGAVPNKPLSQLDISIAEPAGKLPTTWPHLLGRNQSDRRPAAPAAGPSPATTGKPPASTTTRSTSKKSTSNATATNAATAVAAARAAANAASNQPHPPPISTAASSRSRTAWPPNAPATASTRSATTAPAAATPGAATAHRSTPSPTASTAGFWIGMVAAIP